MLDVVDVQRLLLYRLTPLLMVWKLTQRPQEASGQPRAQPWKRQWSDSKHVASFTQTQYSIFVALRHSRLVGRCVTEIEPAVWRDALVG